MRCEHEHDDGSYVLGALPPSERAAYERHLATCSFCREAVADIAVLPGLLGRLDPADFAKLLDPTLSAPSPDRTPNLITATQLTRRRDRKKTRVRMLSTAFAAAVVALVLGVGAVLWMGPDTPKAPLPGPTVVMRAVGGQDVPVSARLSLTALSGGTKVNLVCSYDDTATPEPHTIWLMAYGPDGQTDAMGSWVASPGKEFSMSGVTHFVGANLSRLALVQHDGKAVLAYDVP
jgi:anti-sigma-K factor RskA